MGLDSKMLRYRILLTGVVRLKYVSKMLLIFILFSMTCVNDRFTSYDDESFGIWITNLKTNSIVGGIVYIGCGTSNDDIVKSIELIVDGMHTGLIDTLAPFLFKWDASQLPEGSIHEIMFGVLTQSNDFYYSEPIRLIVKRYPQEKLEIYPIRYINNSFHIEWTRYTNVDFRQYKLYESSTPDGNNPKLIYSSENVNDTSYIVQNIDMDIFLYYTVEVLNSLGFTSISNIRRGSSYPLITYQSDQEIFIMDIDGESNLQLTSTNNTSSNPIFSPNGEMILYRSSDNLFIMDKYGEEKIPLIIGNISNTYNFTPEGSKIIYVSNLNSDRVLFISNVDGSDQKQLTFNDEYIESSAISPDNLSIIYTTRINDSTSIWKMDFNGQNKICLTSGYLYYSDLDYSHDGSRIVYIANDLPGGEDIFILDITTKKSNNITNTPNIMEFYPLFSPDGRAIFYECYTNNRDLCRIDIESRMLTNITNSSTSELEMDLLYNGSLLVFRSLVAGNNEIFTIKSDGSDLKQLTDNTVNDRHPKFQRRE
jgi:TolB protein